MKYGQALEQRSVPEWAPYNVDYNELKYLIKVNTTRDQGQAIAIPGHDDTALQKFENVFFAELWNQHDRVDLFVKSKADEYSRKLHDYQKKLINLIARNNFESGRGISRRRMEKLNRLENKILSCGEDIKNLKRFVEAQRTAFHKILKKYRKWTGSTALSTRFNDEVLSSPKSFTRRDFWFLDNQYNVLLSILRESTPPQSEISSPIIQSRPDLKTSAPSEPESYPNQPQQYWNEYDNGSEAGSINEPYAIYIDPNATTSFPGVESIIYVVTHLSSTAKVHIEKVKSWFGPKSTPDERRPLVSDDGHTGEVPARSNSINDTETDFDDDISSDYPTGYEAHYATFPSVSDQKLFRNRDHLLLFGTVASFSSSFILLLGAFLLVVTGRHRLRVEVDAGVIVGVVASLFFASLGFTTMLVRWPRLGGLHITCVLASFLTACILSGILLIIVMGQRGL